MAMSTAAIVTQLKLMGPNYTRPQILSALDMVQSALLKTRLESNIYIDTSTGDLPHLGTTAGTFQYTVNTTSIPIFEVGMLVTAADSPYSQFWLNQAFYTSNSLPPVEPVKISGRIWWSCPIKTTFETGSTGPVITCLFDPGTTTDTYHIVGYRAPTALTSERIAVSVPDGLIPTVLLPATALYMDALENGRFDEALQKIDQVYRPRLQSYVEGVDNISDYYSTPQMY